jgi:hypothetical protein
MLMHFSQINKAVAEAENQRKGLLVRIQAKTGAGMKNMMVTFSLKEVTRSIF